MCRPLYVYTLYVYKTIIYVHRPGVGVKRHSPVLDTMGSLLVRHNGPPKHFSPCTRVTPVTLQRITSTVSGLNSKIYEETFTLATIGFGPSETTILSRTKRRLRWNEPGCVHVPLSTSLDILLSLSLTPTGHMGRFVFLSVR